MPPCLSKPIGRIATKLKPLTYYFPFFLVMTGYFPQANGTHKLASTLRFRSLTLIIDTTCRRRTTGTFWYDGRELRRDGELWCAAGEDALLNTRKAPKYARIGENNRLRRSWQPNCYTTTWLWAAYSGNTMSEKKLMISGGHEKVFLCAILTANQALSDSFSYGISFYDAETGFCSAKWAGGMIAGFRLRKSRHLSVPQ